LLWGFSCFVFLTEKRREKGWREVGGGGVEGRKRLGFPDIWWWRIKRREREQVEVGRAVVEGEDHAQAPVAVERERGKEKRLDEGVRASELGWAGSGGEGSWARKRGREVGCRDGGKKKARGREGFYF
jgi:hypothetical protein